MIALPNYNGEGKGKLGAFGCEQVGKDAWPLLRNDVESFETARGTGASSVFAKESL